MGTFKNTFPTKLYDFVYSQPIQEMRQSWYKLRKEKFVENNLKFSTILADNRKYLNNTLGKQTFCKIINGYKLHVWVITTQYGYLYLVTAKNRGTSVHTDFQITNKNYKYVLVVLQNIFKISFNNE